MKTIQAILTVFILINTVTSQAANSCISVTQGSITNPTIGQWWSVSDYPFFLTNTCSSSTSITNLGINVYWLINGASVSAVNVLKETGSPYLTQTAVISGDHVAITLSSPDCSGSCDWANLKAGGVIQMDLQVGFGGIITTSAVTKLEVLGGGINNTGQLSITATLPTGLSSASGSISNSNGSFPFTVSTASPSAALNLNTGNYNVALQGLGDIVAGTYFDYTPKTTNIVAGANSLTLTSGATQSQTQSVTVQFTGDSCATSVSFNVASQNYIYLNTVTVSNGATVTLVQGENYSFNAKRVIGCVATITISGSTLNVALQQITPNKYNVGGYYQSWSDKYQTDPTKVGIANLPSYLTYVMIAFANPVMNYTKGANDWAGTGVGFTPSFQVVKSAIQIAHNNNPNQLFLLSVGGATYPWLPGQNNYQAIVDLANDLGVDGVDIDFEYMPICTGVDTKDLKCSTDDEIIEIITKLRTGLGPSMLLTAAVFSVGAFGSEKYPYSKYFPLGSNYDGDWVNPMKAAGNMLNASFIMSYDAGTTYYPEYAYEAYQDIYKGPLFIGFEVPPEAWGGNVLDLPRAANLTNYVKANSNNGGGIFVWSLQKVGNYTGLTAQAYIQQSCTVFGLSNCTQTLPF